MLTHVQHAYIDTSLLTIPYVRVRLRVATLPKVVSENGTESVVMFGFNRKVQNAERTKLMSTLKRDWRVLRTNFLNLDFKNLDSVCAWLGSAGYVAEVILESPKDFIFTAGDVERMAKANRGWRNELVTPAICQWLEKYRDVFQWLMQLEEREFCKSIRAAREFREEQNEFDRTQIRVRLFERKVPLLKNPADAFLKKIGAQNLDANVLGLALRGTSESEQLGAHLHWDDEGFPTVAAYANSPLEALCVSIHIEHFSQRRTVQCPCGKWFDQIRGKDRFHSERCRNFYVTKERRKKIGMVKQTAQDWAALPARKKANRDRAEWIANRISKVTSGKYKVEPLWVRKMLRGSVAKKQSAPVQQREVPTENAVTRKGRAAERAERK